MTDFNIIWTKVDEAPALATFVLLPVVAFVRDYCYLSPMGFFSVNPV